MVATGFWGPNDVQLHEVRHVQLQANDVNKNEEQKP